MDALPPDVSDTFGPRLHGEADPTFPRKRRLEIREKTIEVRHHLWNNTVSIMYIMFFFQALKILKADSYSLQLFCLTFVDSHLVFSLVSPLEGHK